MAQTTSRAAIVAAARTPIGTARKGALAHMPAVELAKPVVAAAIERSGLDAAEFDGLVLAESLQGGGDSARYVAVDVGLTGVAGMASRELGLDEDIVNVYGSGISLGHPIAATGARMVTSAIYELRRRGGGIGVLSMCAGGGMGAAMVIEVA